MEEVLGVSFGNYHTWRDWGLFQMGPASLSVPVVQTNYVEVTGRNGLLDLSTAVTGEPIYQSRDLSIPFMSLTDPEDWPGLYSQILNAIHGKALKIVLDEDPGYYYTGRLAVDFPFYDGTWQFSVTGVIYPYKLRQLETVVTANLSTEDVEIQLFNERMTVTPTITVDAKTTLTWPGYSVALDPGADQIIPALVLKEGENVVKAHVASGTGTITITYRGGSL